MSEAIQVCPRDDDQAAGAVCLYCREPAPQALPCAGCGAVCHPECLSELRPLQPTCPTPGCGALLPALIAPGSLDPGPIVRPRREHFLTPPSLAEVVAPRPERAASVDAVPGLDPSRETQPLSMGLLQAVKFVTGYLGLSAGVTSIAMLLFHWLVPPSHPSVVIQPGELEAALGMGKFALLSLLVACSTGALARALRGPPRGVRGATSGSPS